MTLDEFIALLILATAMTFTPGPNTTLSTAMAANFGLRRTIPFCLGVPVGWTFLLLLCTAGFGTLVIAVPALRWGLKGIGAAYLLWLAWRLARTRVLDSAEKPQRPANFVQGVLLQFVNIKAWMLALTMTAGWIVADGVKPAETHQRVVIVAATMLFFAFISNFIYALVGAVLRDWLSRGNRLLIFNRVLALVLALTAAWMIKA